MSNEGEEGDEGEERDVGQVWELSLLLPIFHPDLE